MKPLGQKKLSSWLIDISLFLLLAFAPFLFIFQGLDFTDTGYVLVSSRDVLIDPENVPSYSIFLTLVINGIWMKISNSFGLLGARIGYGFVYWGIFACSYSILKEFMPRREVLVWILLTFLLSRQSEYISYNNLTSLFALLSLTVMYWGFVNKNLCLFFISGTVSALSVFVRFPNILMVIFVFLPFLSLWLSHNNWRKSDASFQGGIFLLGFLLGGLLAVGIMEESGFLAFFMGSIKKIETAALDENTTYFLKNLFSLYVRDFKRVVFIGILLLPLSGTMALQAGRSSFLKVFLPALLCLGAFYYGNYHVEAPFYWNWHFFVIALWVSCAMAWGALSPFEKSERLFRLKIKENRKKIGSFFLGIAAPVASVYGLHKMQLFRFFDPVFGILLMILLLSIVRLRQKGNEKTALVFLMALFLMVLIPIGSNIGIRNAVFGLWLALPLALHLIWSKAFFPFFFTGSQKLNAAFYDAAGLYRLLFILPLVFASFIGTYRFTYRDTSERLEMRYRIAHPKLKGIFTTRERSEAVQDVLDQLKKYVKPGDFLLGYHNVSLIYYITETKPYLKTAWPFLAEPEVLKTMIQKANEERPDLPVAVRAKFSLQNRDWPSTPYQNKTRRYSENMVLMDEFLQKYNYRKVWGNNVFEIYIPKDNSNFNNITADFTRECRHVWPELKADESFIVISRKVKEQIRSIQPDLKNYVDIYNNIGTYLNYEKVKKYKENKSMRFDESGIPMILYGQQFYYNATVLAQYVLTEYSKFVTGRLESKKTFFSGVEKLLSLQSPNGGFANIYSFRHGFTSEVLEPGWISATATGQALSVIARLFSLTKDPRYFYLGERTVNYLATPLKQGGGRTSLAGFDRSLEGFIFFEEFRTKKEVFTLEGHLAVLLGLSDWKEALSDMGKRSQSAASLLEEGLQSLRFLLPYYETEGLSAVNLAHYTLEGRKPFITFAHHRLHVSMLNSLSQAVRDPFLRVIVDRWKAVFGESGESEEGMNGVKDEGTEPD